MRYNALHGHTYDHEGEVVGLSSANASIYLKDCLAVPRKEELNGSQ